MADRRPLWYRPRNVLLVVLLVAVGLVVYAVAWALTAEPEPTVDYGKRLETLTARAQPPGENAWPYLVEAARIMEAVRAELAEEGLDFDDDSPEGLEIIRRAITRLRAGGAFDQLALAGRCPNAVRPRPSLDEGSLLSSLMPELAHLRMLSQARVASMELARSGGVRPGAGDGRDVLGPGDLDRAAGRLVDRQPRARAAAERGSRAPDGCEDAATVPRPA
jgi:hypothetical protein